VICFYDKLLNGDDDDDYKSKNYFFNFFVLGLIKRNGYLMACLP